MTQPLADPAFAPPAADTLLIDPDTVPEQHREFIPRYGDQEWSILAISQNPSASRDTIFWARYPDGLREQFRHAAWALATCPMPAFALVRHGPAFRARLSPGRIYRTVADWRFFAEWITERGLGTLAQVTVEDLVDYSLHLAKVAGLARNTVLSHLTALSRLSTYSAVHLPPEHRLVEPPWLAEGVDDYLPAATSQGENLTEPISPATMGPLLVWALRFVDDFAEDILAAHEERCRLLAVSEAAEGKGGRKILAEWANNLVAEGRTIPTWIREGEPVFSATYVSGLTGVARDTVNAWANQEEWSQLVQANAGPSTLDTPVTGMLGGQPWHSGIEFHEVAAMVRRLVSACFVVLAYLTGMRPGEVLSLEAGCCPEPEDVAGSARRHLIYGRQFKLARDEDGNHLSAGVLREVPWVAVPQAVRAIRVLERFVGEGLLFGATAHDPRSTSRRMGRSLGTTTMGDRVEDFIKWVNEFAAARGRDGEVIPPDPNGRVGIVRFRRTLAWHIARRPGGLVALATQYGHMRTIVSQGYASRSRGGIHDLLDFETARTVAEHLSDVHEAIQDGEGVSGPAARRLINAAAQEHERFGGMVATVRQARTLLADPTLNVFENKQAYLICNYDRSKALCRLDRGGKDDTPSLDRCRSNCANIARTDSQAVGLDKAADHLLEQAQSPIVPHPMADRFREKAAELHRLAEDHRRDRITAQEVPA